MSWFGSALRRALLDRRPGGRPGQVGRLGYGRPRPRGRFGLWGPVPYYSTHTRRGSEVSVGGCGCCLPIPLFVAVSMAGGLRALWRWAR